MDPQLNLYAPPTTAVNQVVEVAYADDYILASRGARFLGSLLDGLFMFVLMIPMVFIMGIKKIGNLREILEIYTFMAIPVLLYAGIQWTLITKSGQSIGKKIMGIKIVQLDGSPCGFVHGVILRSWIVSGLGMIPMVGGLFSLVDILLIFRSDQRCGHDLIANTRVICAPMQE